MIDCFLATNTVLEISHDRLALFTKTYADLLPGLSSSEMVIEKITDEQVCSEVVDDERVLVALFTYSWQ